MNFTPAYIKQQLAAIERVRQLHSACLADDVCDCHNHSLECMECNRNWPCPTIKALEPDSR